MDGNNFCAQMQNSMRSYMESRVKQLKNNADQQANNIMILENVSQKQNKITSTYGKSSNPIRSFGVNFGAKVTSYWRTIHHICCVGKTNNKFSLEKCVVFMVLRGFIGIYQEYHGIPKIQWNTFLFLFLQVFSWIINNWFL